MSSVVTEVLVLLHRGTFTPVNFFSFFTVESNIFAAMVLLFGGFTLLCPKKPVRYDMIRGAAVLYMAITGIIFAALLSGLDAGVLTAVPWDNTVLHYIMPIVVFGDWLLDPPVQRISFKRALIWLSYPFAYLVYTLVRGALVGWYPYPFLDAGKNSYESIAVVSLGIAVVVSVITFVITKIMPYKGSQR